MRVLVTGGAGYIGSHTVLKLKEAGHWTVVYDNLSKGYKGQAFGDEFVEGDIHNSQQVKEALKKYDIDAVMHFAAFIEAGESMKDPSKYFLNNSVGSITLLGAMLESKVNNFIFSSTAALFGYPDKIPIEEETPLNPVNAYGESKLLVEKVLKWYSDIYGFNYISLRYFNAAGADKKLRTGERHDPETHLIPLAIQTALGERKSLSIYGTNYDTPDGTCVRDYIHVEDLADAHVLALAYLAREKKSNIFNLGSEKGYSVRQVIDVVKEVTGRDFKVIETKRRLGDAPTLIASSAKIKKILGWNPEFNDLRKIVETAVNFYMKQNDLT